MAVFIEFPVVVVVADELVVRYFFENNVGLLEDIDELAVLLVPNVDVVFMVPFC